MLIDVKLRLGSWSQSVVINAESHRWAAKVAKKLYSRELDEAAADQGLERGAVEITTKEKKGG